MKNQRDNQGKFITGHDPLFPKPIEYTEKLQKLMRKKERESR